MNPDNVYRFKEQFKAANNLQELAAAFAGLRKEFGFSQERLAQYVGLSVGSIEKIERSQRVRRATLETLIKHFGLREHNIPSWYIAPPRKKPTFEGLHPLSENWLERLDRFVRKNPLDDDPVGPPKRKSDGRY